MLANLSLIAQCLMSIEKINNAGIFSKFDSLIRCLQNDSSTSLCINKNEYIEIIQSFNNTYKYRTNGEPMELLVRTTGYLNKEDLYQKEIINGLEWSSLKQIQNFKGQCCTKQIL